MRLSSSFGLAALLVSCGGDNAARTDTTAEPRAAPQAQPNAAFGVVFVDSAMQERPFAEFDFKGSHYRVLGNDSMPGSGGERAIRLSLDDAFYIEKVRVGEYSNDLLVLLDITDSESGAGVLARVSPTGDVKWRYDIKAFNITDPVVRGGEIYFAGIGLVAKVGLDDGQPKWMHDELYEQASGAFNIFQPPQFAGDTVVFRDERLPRAVKVLNSSGELIPS